MSFPRYPKYRDSGVAWLAKIPAHWHVVRLKTLLAEVDERAGSDSLELLGLSKSLGVVQRSDIEQGASESDDYSKYKIAKAGQLVMNKMQAWNGVFGLSPKLGMVSPDYAVFCFLRRGFENFLCMLFRTEIMSGEFFTRCRGMGTAFLRLNTSDFLNIKIGVPPCDEAGAIAGVLDAEISKIDALIVEQQRLMELLKEKRQAVISQTVTKGLNPRVSMKSSGVEWLGDVPRHWVVKPVKFIAKVGNGSTPNREIPEYWGGNYPWLNSSCVNQEQVTESEEFVTPLALEDCHLPKISPPAVLVGITGQGRTRGMATTLLVEATINQHIAFLKPRGEAVDVLFLRRVFDMAYGFLRRESEAGGSTKGAITCDQIGNLKIPVPPLEEQLQIVSSIQQRATEFDSLVEEAQCAVILLEERRSVLISAAVTGQIDVREVASQVTT